VQADVARLCGRWPILPATMGQKPDRLLLRIKPGAAILHMTESSLQGVSEEIWSPGPRSST
jgi:hypothetical protein